MVTFNHRIRQQPAPPKPTYPEADQNGPQRMTRSIYSTYRSATAQYPRAFESCTVTSVFPYASWPGEQE